MAEPSTARCPCAQRPGAPQRPANHKGRCWWRREGAAGLAPQHGAAAAAVVTASYSPERQLVEALAILQEAADFVAHSYRRLRRERPGPFPPLPADPPPRP